MKVLYDYVGFSSRIGGVSRYVCEIIGHMPKDIHYEIALKQSDNVYLWDKQLMDNVSYPKLTAKNYIPFKFPLKIRVFNSLEKHFISFPSTKNINKAYSIEKIKEGDYDLLHHTRFNEYFLPYIGNKPFVFTVHDLIHEIYNTRIEDQKAKKVLSEKAAHIIAISQNTKEDLMRIYNVPESKITVIHHGGPDLLEFDKKPIVESPYVLFVGRRKNCKNFNQTLKDFAVFQKQHPAVMLVCTGTPFVKDERMLIAKLGLKNNVIQMFVTEEQLANLYYNALAFVYPSLYEGFGLPILEAYTYQCPVLLNKKSCFPEIAGDAALYFDSKPGESNLSEILFKIYNLPVSERKKLIEAGNERLKLYNWKNAAMQTADVYRNIIQK